MGPIFHIQLLHPDTRHSCKKILAESHQKKSYWRKDYFSVHQSNVQAYFKQNSSSGALKRALASPTADWATTHDPQNDYRDVSLNCLQVRRSRFGRPVCRFVRSRVILIHSTLNKKKANLKKTLKDWVERGRGNYSAFTFKKLTFMFKTLHSKNRVRLTYCLLMKVKNSPKQ